VHSPIEQDDAEEALKIMRYAMYHDASADVADNKKVQSGPTAATDVEAESVQEMDVAEDDNFVRPEDSQHSQADDSQNTSSTRYEWYVVE